MHIIVYEQGDVVGQVLQQLPRPPPDSELTRLVSDTSNLSLDTRSSPEASAATGYTNQPVSCGDSSSDGDSGSTRGAVYPSVATFAEPLVFSDSSEALLEDDTRGEDGWQVVQRRRRRGVG